MYTFHALFSEDNIKVMSKTFLQLSIASLFLGNLFKASEDIKRITNGSAEIFFLHYVPIVTLLFQMLRSRNTKGR